MKKSGFFFKYNSLEEFIHHIVSDLARTGAVEFDDLVLVGTVRIQRPELTASVPEQDEEVLALRARDLLEHSFFSLSVDDSGEDTVFDGV